MSTLRKHISDVRSSHKLLSSDNRITDRAIASELKMNGLLLIKRETNLRRLWNTSTIFFNIPCLEMKEVPLSECCDYVEEKTIARTVYKIPRILEGIYGYVIQGVYSINIKGGKGTKFTEINIERYLNLQKLRTRKNQRFYWIQGDYLYITDPDISKISISALFESDIPKEILYSECSCNGNPLPEEYCINPVDRESFIPGYLEKQVQSLTSEKLLSTYYSLKTDISTNGIDGQAPNSPPGS